VDVLTPRPLGRTGLSVTPLCVGTGELGDMTSVYGYAVPEERALATVRSAFAGPFTFVDTSNGYGAGTSERRIGAVVRELGGVPDGVLLATKVDPVAGGPFDGPRVRASFEESLANLGVDRIRLLHLHDPERISFAEATAPGGPVEVMQQLVAEGLVDHIGVAGGPIDLLRRFVATGAFDVVLTHNRWTLLDRSAEPLLADCADAGVAVLNGAPFGGGLLVKGPAAQPKYAYGPAREPVLQAAAAMERACAEHDVPLAAAALQYSLREPRIVSTVVGMSRPERLEQTVRLATHPIPDELWTVLADLTPAEENWLR
jgi:D-threo-aldose 1-dehydrogenase